MSVFSSVCPSINTFSVSCEYITPRERPPLCYAAGIQYISIAVHRISTVSASEGEVDHHARASRALSVSNRVKISQS